MRKFATLVAAAGLAASVVAAGPAAQDPPEGYQFEMELKKGDTATYDAPAGGGGAAVWNNFGLEDPNLCGHGDYTDYCDKGILTVGASGSVTINVAAAYPVADFDLFVYTWDGNEAGEEVTHDGAPPGSVETVTFDAKRGDEFAVVIYYYAAGGGYSLDATLS